MTVTATKTERIEKKIEVDVPAYFGFGVCYFKIINEEDYIEVADNGEEMGVKVKKNAGIVGLVVDDGAPIEKRAFDERYQTVLNKLTNRPI